MFPVEAVCFSGSAGRGADREKRLLKLHMLGGQESRRGTSAPIRITRSVLRCAWTAESLSKIVRNEENTLSRLSNPQSGTCGTGLGLADVISHFQTVYSVYRIKILVGKCYLYS
jgi:hypothetical protein